VFFFFREREMVLILSLAQGNKKKNTNFDAVEYVCNYNARGSSIQRHSEYSTYILAPVFPHPPFHPLDYPNSMYLATDIARTYRGLSFTYISIRPLSADLICRQYPMPYVQIKPTDCIHRRLKNRSPRRIFLLKKRVGQVMRTR